MFPDFRVVVVHELPPEPATDNRNMDAYNIMYHVQEDRNRMGPQVNNRATARYCIFTAPFIRWLFTDHTDYVPEPVLQCSLQSDLLCTYKYPLYRTHVTSEAPLQPRQATRMFTSTNLVNSGPLMTHVVDGSLPLNRLPSYKVGLLMGSTSFTVTSGYHTK